MSCPVLHQLAEAVAAVPDLAVPVGLGADVVLDEQTGALAAAVALLQRQLAVRMAARQRHGPGDVRGDAARAGLPRAQAARLHQLGAFAAEHPDLQAAWLAGTIGDDHLAAVRDTAGKLPTPALRSRLVALLLPHLPALDARTARALASATADQLAPGDPDTEEQADHAARRLAWSTTPGGGLVLEGYLPTAEAAAFTAAIDALVRDLRTTGDGLTGAQRRADALAALIARADLPTAGGTPPAVTLTVSLTEATRIAHRDPAHHGNLFQRRPQGGSRIGTSPAGDAAVRFGLCCAAITPTLHDTPDPVPDPTGLLGRIAATKAEPLAVGRAVRLATPAQRTALRLRDGGCAIPDCAVTDPHTQPHHVTGWAIDGPTDLDNLISLCFVHHRQVELGRFTLTRRHHDQPRPAGALEHPRWWITPPQPQRTA
jgi:hypothetical protein